MSYETWLDERMDYISGTPCANCETERATAGTLFCSAECREEYEGADEGTYADDYVDGWDNTDDGHDGYEIDGPSFQY